MSQSICYTYPHKEEWCIGKPFVEGGILHRVDGPAVIHSDGRQLWYQNGKPHRVGGPARLGPHPVFNSKHGWEYPYSESWFVDGKEITEAVSQWIDEMNFPKLFADWTSSHKILFKTRFG